MIKLENITKTYDGKAQVHALKGVNLTIEDGEIFGIIGKSGAGKSTLVRCINMLERPTSGNVIIDEKNLTNMTDAQLRAERKHIGMIFQHFNLLSSRTVFDNIAFPLELIGASKEAIQKKVADLLELVGLTDRQFNYPAQLSGGQKQRVGIARALASDPNILLCDEATSALDPQTTKSILELLKDINQRLGITIVIITHEMAVIKEICNRVAVIHRRRRHQGSRPRRRRIYQSPVPDDEGLRQIGHQYGAACRHRQDGYYGPACTGLRHARPPALQGRGYK